jgi:very-short-patch-repair endonuclease
MRQPSPASQGRSCLSREGRDLKQENSEAASQVSREGRDLQKDKEESAGQVSPLAGETDLRSKSGEGPKRSFAKQLRSNMTDVETKLWQQLRAKRFEDFKFRRQVPIGPYIVDFICYERRLIIELDGSQHEGSTYDMKRDAWLHSQDFRVLRFWNNDVNAALDGTLMAIHDALGLPSPASQGRGCLSREGRDLKKEKNVAKSQVSPLAGQTDLQSKSGEGKS